MITQERLKELFEYHEDGFLVNRFTRGPARKGKMAGSILKERGLTQYKVMADRKQYYGQRLIFLYHHWYLPELVKHKDKDTANNRIENLIEDTIQRKAPKKLTQELVKEHFYYENGKLIRKRVGEDREAKSKFSNGYLRASIYGKDYLVHRLIFLYHHGYLPKCVDHINRDKLDNRIENLRKATNKENSRNCSGRRNSTSKYKGVQKSRNNWNASATLNGTVTYLGSFDREIDAAKAYNDAVIKAHGTEFEYLNDLGNETKFNGPNRYKNNVGEKNPGSKLNEENVRDMLRDHKKGLTTKQLSKKYGVNDRTIRAVVTRKSWKHVKEGD